MTPSDCDLQAHVTKLTKKYSNDVSSALYRQLLVFRACAGSPALETRRESRAARWAYGVGDHRRR